MWEEDVLAEGPRLFEDGVCAINKSGDFSPLEVDGFRFLYRFANRLGHCDLGGHAQLELLLGVGVCHSSSLLLGFHPVFPIAKGISEDA